MMKIAKNTLINFDVEETKRQFKGHLDHIICEYCEHIAEPNKTIEPSNFELVLYTDNDNMNHIIAVPYEALSMYKLDTLEKICNSITYGLKRYYNSVIDNINDGQFNYISAISMMYLLTYFKDDDVINKDTLAVLFKLAK